MLKKTISVCMILSFFLAIGGSVSFAQRAEDDYAKFMKEDSVYANLANFLRYEQQRNYTSRNDVKDTVIVYVLDFLFSALCLWLAAWLMTGVKILDLKKYLC